MLTIGETAEVLGISAHTLRYYEKERIVLPLRDAGGDRRYDESHISWLKFVIKLKETQMPIAAIQKYASLVREGEHTAEARVKLLAEHKRSIRAQLETLTAADEMLERKIAGYRTLIGSSR
ncbi:MerR family transcriptional regulator [Saccharibacillus alkalitolerans]|uniref:MerR family transcriptional regulator n=1 Tax=Saccharibacillus alkalitolerans TaxID=2705290 RepID=A0ABX0FAM7_9BACL|nr:MerR family transcriptional regulator [Saccharibacillus alkalitolerans]NGZ77338.1 MerR family transcriptional regulator [Saccharibacillus alkalitolerans]